MDIQKQAYREEAYELLADLEDALIELEQNPDDFELISRVFRNMHTIKGSGSMFGFDDIARFTHGIETVYDTIREGNLKVSKELISLTLASCDQIKTMLQETQESSEEDLAKRRELEAAFTNLLPREKDLQVQEETISKPDDIEEKTFRIRFKPHADLFENGTNPLPLIDELCEHGDAIVICYMENLPPIEELDAEKCYTYWDIILTTTTAKDEIRDTFMFVDDISDIKIDLIDSADEKEIDYKKIGEILLEKGDIDNEKLNAALKSQKKVGQMMVEEGIVKEPKVKSALAEQQQIRELRKKRTQMENAASVRVASVKLDGLVDLVGELVIVQARLSQLAAFRNDADLVVIAEEVERLSAELRDNTMGIRMLPIGTTFARFKRLVRDLSEELGKEIDFETEGAETELDKTVIEKLGDPLVHLIRNSIDHGIENPADRKNAGKKTQGIIKLSALHSGAYVLIRIEDDGKGLDPQIIRAKAEQKGLITKDTQLTEKETLELIFAPGFSTAETVSNISGRGVGMDVVVSSIESLGGSVDIQSTLGQGTIITLKLPLTLAIIDGLLVDIGDDFFVIPLGTVLECIELSTEDIERAHGRHIAKVREEIVPYIYLREIFGIDGQRPELEQIVVTEVNDRRVGFVVDRVIGQHQTVIKNLGKTLKEIEGISGATIMGDGTVALILDVNKLIQHAEIDEVAAVAG